MLLLHCSFWSSTTSTQQTRASPSSAGLRSVCSAPSTSSRPLWPPASYPRPVTAWEPPGTSITWKSASPTSCIGQRWSSAASTTSTHCTSLRHPTGVGEALSRFILPQPTSSPAAIEPTALHGFPTSSCAIYSQQRRRRRRPSASPTAPSTSTSPNLHVFRFPASSPCFLQWPTSTCSSSTCWRRRQ